MSGRRGSPRILLLGATGQVGWELARTLSPFGEVVAPDRETIDLARPDEARMGVQRYAPDCVVNAAAYTRVDDAECEGALAFRVNAEAPGALADEAERQGALFVHYSTDYVFDGTADTPYVESSEPNPQGVYGASKLAGERAVSAAAPSALILRTSWVYGLRGSNFARTMLRRARLEEPLRVVDDQWGSPTWSRVIAEATTLMLSQLRRDGRFSAGSDEKRGLFHMTASGQTTWRRFAEEILARDPARAEHRCGEIVPIRTDEYPTAATRPRFSVLDNSRLEDTWGITLPSWQEQLGLAMSTSEGADRD